MISLYIYIYIYIHYIFVYIYIYEFDIAAAMHADGHPVAPGHRELGHPDGLPSPLANDVCVYIYIYIYIYICLYLAS